MLASLRSLTEKNPVSNVGVIALSEIPLNPLFQKGGRCRTTKFPLFEKEGPGEIWDKTDEKQ